MNRAKYSDSGIVTTRDVQEPHKILNCLQAECHKIVLFASEKKRSNYKELDG